MNEKTELKTLKDIGGRIERLNVKHEAKTRYVSTELLRQEAVKWIKHIRDRKHYRTPIFNQLQDFQEDKDNLITWIMYFFNITEDELK